MTLLKARSAGMVLVGHGFTTSATDPIIESQHRDITTVMNAIAVCRSLGFRFISMHELIKLAQAGFKSDAPWIHLTFDDGYQNNYTVLYPFLKSSRIPFSLFISTDHIAQNQWFYHDRIRCALLNTHKAFCFSGTGKNLAAEAEYIQRLEFIEEVSHSFRSAGRQQVMVWMRQIDELLSAEEWAVCRERYPQNEPMSLDQLREMSCDPIVYLGSHNHHHINLNENVQEGDVREEMQTSKSWLAKHSKINTLAYCFPKGKPAEDFTPTATRICREVGYQVAFTTVEAPVVPGVDRYQIPRTGIPASDAELEKRLLMYSLPASLVKSIVSIKHIFR